jgi:4-hydroxy-tetrahydrodipicolinate synthase
MLVVLAGLAAAQRLYQPVTLSFQPSVAAAPFLPAAQFRPESAYQVGSEPGRTAVSKVPQWTGFASAAVVCGLVGALIRPRAGQGLDARSALRSAALTDALQVQRRARATRRVVMAAIGGVNPKNLLRKEDLRGAFTALVTPFKPSGEVDFDALRALVETNIQEGINGLVPVGTTGESPTLNNDEHDAVIRVVVEQAAGRVPVIAGTGSNSTAEAVRLTEEAAKSGANAALIVNPYYNKPNQLGLLKHFQEIGKVGLPVVLYNIPGRTGITMDASTIAALHEEFPWIIAVKEATGSLDQTSLIKTMSDIVVLSGDDSLTLPLMSVGASGVISVLSNLSPRMVLDITDNALAGNYEAAREAHLGAFPLMRALFSEVNPQPVKEALYLAGKIPCPDLRLPLVNVSDETHKELVKKMLAAGYLLRAPGGSGASLDAPPLPSAMPAGAVPQDELA